MSLTKILNKGKQRLTVNVSTIRENPNNIYIDNEYYKQPTVNTVIEGIANSINTRGQIHNLAVYSDTSLDDGKEYTLLSGAKRYRAILSLVEQEKSDGMVDVLIFPKPSDLAEEMAFIREANIQGNPALKDHALLYQEILQLEMQYDELKEQGKVPKGLFKRPYVATRLGVGEITVTNIKNEFEGKDTSKPKKKKTPKQIEKEARLAKYKEVGDEIYEDAFGSCCDGIKLTDKELTFKFSSLEDLVHLLYLMNVDVSIDKLKEV